MITYVLRETEPLAIPRRGILLSTVSYAVFKGDMSKFSSAAGLLGKEKPQKRFQLSLLCVAVSTQNTWYEDTSSDDEKARQDC